MFNEFEEEYKTAAVALEDQLKQIRATIPERGAPPPTTVGAFGRGDKVAKAGRLLNQVKDLVSNMEIEINVLLPKERAASKQRVEEYRKKSTAFSADFDKLKADALVADRSELLAVAKARTKSQDGGAAGDASAVGATAEMAKASQTMDKSTKKLKEAERLTVEMNATADNTLEELARQRKVTDNIGNKVVDVDQDLSDIQRLLRDMHRTIMKNKAVMAAIILLLLIMIIGLLYYQFGGGSSTTTITVSETPPPPPLTHGPDLPDVNPSAARRLLR